MCSIAGIINGNLKSLREMIHIQSHRAPDENGFFQNKNIFIGMGRLKIIDLKSKNLCPFEDKDLVLSYNGEIYNYIEIRKELKKYKYKFKTTSDIEVLANSWKHWGYKMFEKLNGMFAICIYDKKKNVIMLARDIAGEKPLYYSKTGNKFYFASEAKAIKKVCNNKVIKNRIINAFQHCISDTLWKDIYQLQPGHHLTINLNNLRFKIEEYWKFKNIKIDLKHPEEQLEELLIKSIKLRLRSDVNFGLYYSKGMDSTLLSSLFNFKHKFYFNDQKSWKNDLRKLHTI